MTKCSTIQHLLHRADKIAYLRHGRNYRRIMDWPELDPRIEDFAWTFGVKSYENYETFEAEFEECQKALTGKLLQAGFLLLEAPAVIVMFDGIQDGHSEYDEMELVIHPSDQKSLSFGELMYRLNNLTFPFLQKSDYVFYEGLVLADDTRDGLPVLFLKLGS